ncbi:putative SP-containing protein [Vairimorpha necatrix]|uniref:SP-containing protein n=1 Tax=Vairimorpha necatrix TaxID=6039 RepID=A0AAX4JEF6_9MICR
MNFLKSKISIICFLLLIRSKEPSTQENDEFSQSLANIVKAQVIKEIKQLEDEGQKAVKDTTEGLIGSQSGTSSD